jgi:hypothetical protein
LKRHALLVVACALLSTAALAPPAATGGDSIATGDLREWLTYLASDELRGRATYSEGLGLAAAYIQSHLKEWGVEAAGDAGGADRSAAYLQVVRVHGVRTTSRSRLVVRVGVETRTFEDGKGVTFPKNAGGRQTLTLDRVEFVGYGLDLAGAGHHDFQGRNVRGAAVVWLGGSGPKAVDAEKFRRLLSGRRRYAIEQRHALASLGPAPQASAASDDDDPTGDPARQPRAPDFTTTQRLDRPIPPMVTGSDELFDFLFSRAPVPYAQLKRLADDRAPLPAFRLDGVSLTFEIDAEYEILRTSLTQNVVGVVRGTDPQLARTYVAFGAHYDHVGYAESGPTADGGRPRAPGRVTPGATEDRIWNGADDDGSGTTALMAIARAFAAGPRPRRSLLFVWHAGEERGLLGSRYFADYPSVPLDAIVAQLNVDMVGRNRDDKPSEADTVYLVGSDRISTELHEINAEANRSLPQPLTLNYEMNDPSDPEQVYYRSDHYSYAAKGIPVIFYTTGLHPDYHANTDHVAKIEFEKLARVTRLIYETGARLANRDRAPARDNRGPRAGKDTR